MDKKRIMILGAGRGQIDLIKAVKKYGHIAVVASIEGNYPGFNYADEICYVDISDCEAVCAAAENYKVDAITTACLDTGIAALGYTCEHLKLNGLSEKAASLSQDKLLMKNAFMDNKVKTARYKKVSSESELEQLIQDFEFPMIVKAIDLQGSRGINIANNIDELIYGFNNTMTETNKEFCIVEEFIEGYEFGAQAFVVDNEVLYVLPCGDVTYLSKTNIPVGHYSPLELNDSLVGSVKEQSVKAIKALELNNCAVNIDMILKDDEVYVIELTGRVGANCLPQLSSIYFGLDIYKLIIDTALGLDAKAYFFNNKKEGTISYAKMLYSEKEGVLQEIINNNLDLDNIVEITFFVKSGDLINKFTNSKDCLGQVVVKGSTLDECDKLIDDVVSKIEFVLV